MCLYSCDLINIRVHFMNANVCLYHFSTFLRQSAVTLHHILFKVVCLKSQLKKKLFIVLCSAPQPPYRAFIFMNGVSKHVLLLLKWQLHKSKSYLLFFLSKPGRKFPTKRTFIWTSGHGEIRRGQFDIVMLVTDSTLNLMLIELLCHY